MYARLKGPLTIDGIALGQTRSQVDSALGRATTNANPAWARYHTRRDSRESRPLLVRFRPAWPRDAQTWRVDGLHGSVLRRGDLVLVEVGDTCESVGERLGVPDEVFSAEPGYGCMVFEGCAITYDELSFKVVEVALRAPDRHTQKAPRGSASPDRLSGAVA